MENVREISIRRGLGAFFAIATAALMISSALALTAYTSAKVDVKLAYVDIGEYEAMAVLDGWGPAVPNEELNGNYGGYGASGNQTRAVWFETVEGDTGLIPDENERYGIIQIFFSGSARTVTYKHLDGIANDSFDLYAMGEYDWVQIDHYVDYAPISDSEQWLERCVDLTEFMSCGECEILLGGGEFKLMFVATGPAWGGFIPWGQMVFDYILIEGNGNPIP